MMMIMLKKGKKSLGNSQCCYLLKLIAYSKKLLGKGNNNSDYHTEEKDKNC